MCRLEIQTETVTLAAGTLNPDSTEIILGVYRNIQIQGETCTVDQNK
jgi:hypothetical protein